MSTPSSGQEVSSEPKELEYLQQLHRLILTIRKECFGPSGMPGIFKPKDGFDEGKTFVFNFLIREKEIPVEFTVDGEPYVTRIRTPDKSTPPNFPRSYTKFPLEEQGPRNLEEWVHILTEKPDKNPYILLETAAYCFETARNEALHECFLLQSLNPLQEVPTLSPVNYFIKVGQNWNKGTGSIEGKLPELIEVFAALGIRRCRVYMQMPIEKRPPIRRFYEGMLAIESVILDPISKLNTLLLSRKSWERLSEVERISFSPENQRHLLLATIN